MQNYFVENSFFSGQVTVLPFHPESPYFHEKSRIFCFHIQGQFHQEIQAENVLFGIELDKPLENLPWGHSLAVAFIKLIDPALQVDLYAPKPFALSPILCCMNTVKEELLESVEKKRVFEEKPWDSQATLAVPRATLEEKKTILEEKGLIPRITLEEKALQGNALQHWDMKTPASEGFLSADLQGMTSDQRKKHFYSHSFTFQPNRLYTFGTFSCIHL